MHSLPVSIQSVLSQSAGNWELIIIDDGSLDNTKDVIEPYLTDERIFYHFQENAGVSAARNKGVALSKGDYIIFLDSDDRFLPGLISELNKINYQEYDFICWQVWKQVNEKSSVWKPQKLEKIYNYITATFLAGSICYKKEIFLQAGGLDPEMTFGENYELGIRVAEIPDLKVKIINEPFLEYRVPVERKSNSYENRLDSYLHLYKKHFVKFSQDKISNSNMNYLLGYIHEKTGSYEKAGNFFKEAFRHNNLNYKALLKVISYKIFKR